MENPILRLFVYVIPAYTQSCRLYMCYEIVLYPDVLGRAQNETALEFWYEKYCNTKCFINFGYSKMWSMSMSCFWLACLS